MVLQEHLTETKSWEGRPHVQLQEIVQRGLAGGDEFFSAAQEMERRARDHARIQALEEAEAAVVKKKRRRLIWTAACAAIIVLAVVALIV